MKKNKSFNEVVKEKLTKETLEVAWVFKRKLGQRIEFELRCNRCAQFPDGFYEKSYVKDAREAKIVLYKKLMDLLDGI